MIAVLLALAVVVTMACVDFCHARYIGSLTLGQPYRAGLWSIGQWAAVSVGFVVAVKINMWYLVFEPVGLFLGTILGARRVKKV